MTQRDHIIDWLCAGDPSVAFQAKRDLLVADDPSLQNRIFEEGWGRTLLDSRSSSGGWGEAFYAPKWTCTHFTLQTMRKLEAPRGNVVILEVLKNISETHLAQDGGLGQKPDAKRSDVCINAIYLDYSSYFGLEQEHLCHVVDFLLGQIMEDGGFNCRKNGSGARHGSLHSTLSVLEGILSYESAGHQYRLDELQESAETARAFIFQHRFYKSDRTGETINPDFLKMPFPSYWRYNILRALDYFRAAQIPFDERMTESLEELAKRRGPDGKWPKDSALRGKTLVALEGPREPSRWNTLVAMRVLEFYGAEQS